MSFLLKSDTLLRELTSLFLTSVTIYKYGTALVLQFLSTKIFQRTLSFIAQRRFLQSCRRSFPFCECKGRIIPRTGKGLQRKNQVNLIK